MIVDDYLGLIAPEHQNKPKFAATVALSVEPYVGGQSLLASIPPAFDLDAAVGVQLDVVGQWVGVSRRLPVPVANLYFALDVSGAGLDQGYLKGPFSDGVTIANLDDDTYRRLLRARIAANNGVGTKPDAQAILSSFFDNPGAYAVYAGSTYTNVPTNFFSLDDPAKGLDSTARLYTPGSDYPSVVQQAFSSGILGTFVIVQDNAFLPATRTFVSLDSATKGLDSSAVLYQLGLSTAALPTVDMSVTIGITGVTPSVLDLEVLAQNLIPVVPGGVGSNVLVSSISGAPIFGLDIENRYIAGLDVGSTGVTPAYLAGQLSGEFA